MAMETGTLNFQEAREAYEQLYESSNDSRRFTLRMYILYAFNDEYGRAGLVHLEDDENYLFFKENCKELMKMKQMNPTLRAELYREIGEFEECINYLDSLKPTGNFEDEVRSLIKGQAEIGNPTVFRIR